MIGAFQAAILGGSVKAVAPAFLAQYEGGIATTITDTMGNYPLTITGTVNSVAGGTPGNCLDFGAAAGYARSSGDVPEFHNADYFEVEYDIKPNITTNVNCGTVGKWDYATQGTFQIQHKLLSSDLTMTVFIAETPNDAAGGSNRIFDCVLSTSAWTHVKVIYDGTQAVVADRVKAWRNGVEMAVLATNGSINATLTAATAPITVGEFYGLSRVMRGLLDNITIKMTRP